MGSIVKPTSVANLDIALITVASELALTHS
jgi:hypothetical protein